VQRQHGQDEQLRFILGRKKKERNTQTKNKETQNSGKQTK
jgi:hypothetical protein